VFHARYLDPCALQFRVEHKNHICCWTRSRGFESIHGLTVLGQSAEVEFEAWPPDAVDVYSTLIAFPGFEFPCWRSSVSHLALCSSTLEQQGFGLSDSVLLVNMVVAPRL